MTTTLPTGLEPDGRLTPDILRNRDQQDAIMATFDWAVLEPLHLRIIEHLPTWDEQMTRTTVYGAMLAGARTCDEAVAHLMEIWTAPNGR